MPQVPFVTIKNEQSRIFLKLDQTRNTKKQVFKIGYKRKEFGTSFSYSLNKLADNTRPFDILIETSVKAINNEFALSQSIPKESFLT